MATKKEFLWEIYNAAREAGLSPAAAEVTAAQAALETGYGKRAPGFNLFGIKAGKSWKGNTQKLNTWESEGGKKVRQKADFRKYDSFEEAIKDRMAFMDSRYPGFNNATNAGEAYEILRTGGKYGAYATDSVEPDDPLTYEQKLNQIRSTGGWEGPVPPMNVGGVASEVDDGTVAATQRALAARGLYDGEIDGIKGPLTRKAIEDFQAENGLNVDGVAGPKTWAKLGDTSEMGLTPRLGWENGEQVFEGRETRQMIPSRDNAKARLGVGTVGGLEADSRLMNLLVPKAGPRATEAAKSNELEVASAQPSGKVVRLPSGKTITTGIHDGSNGKVQVSDDGNGNAVVTPIRGGIAEEAGKNTIVGGLIRSKIGEVLPQAGQALIEGAGNALMQPAHMLSPVTEAGSNVITGAKANLGGLFGKVAEQFGFGGQPLAAQQMRPSHTYAPVSSPETRFLSLVASPKDIPTEASTRDEMMRSRQRNGWSDEIAKKEELGRGPQWGDLDLLRMNSAIQRAPTPMPGRPAMGVKPNALAIVPQAVARPQPKPKPTGYTASGTPLTSIAEASRWAANYM